ncbi:MAG TPA: ATP-binding protein [Magnetospirillum sp.]|nr:ATP-binding protein [Magnetospirillum sp.]
MPAFIWLRGGLRRHLVVLVLVPLVPMLLWAGGLTLWSSLQERRAFERGLEEAARALSIAVDQEIRLSLSALESVALSRELSVGAIGDFMPIARRLVAAHPDWQALLLFDRYGNVVLDTRSGDGARTGRAMVPARELAERVLSEGKPVVSDVFRLDRADDDMVMVAAPVVDGSGRTVHVLAAAIPSARLGGVLSQPRFPRGWTAWITDAHGALITRTAAAQFSHDATTAAERSPLTGWTVRFGMPDAGAAGNLRGSLGITVGFGVLVLGVSVLLALAIAGRILRPVQALTAIAQPFLHGQVQGQRIFGIGELDALYQALDVLSGELEKSQERFLTVFSAAPVMLFVLDENERLIAVNEAWERTLGYGHDEVLGRTPWEFHTAASTAYARQTAWPEFVRQGSLDRLPAQYVTKQGDVREMLVSLRGDRDPDGRIIRTIGAVQDVTEQRRAEAGMARAVEDAERANDAKTRFLAAASHDLRQPLQALSLYLGVLRARLQGREEQVMEAVGQCVESLTGLLNDMLDVARLDAGVITPKLADVPVNRLLERVAAAWRIQAEAKGLRLGVMPCRAVVHTDPALMDRVLSNLVANSVRYTEHGRILVGARRLPGGLVRIEVLDTGIGIPADKLGEIFEEFRQLGNPERRRDKGTGLGLAIVRRIANLLDHRLEVRSIAGRGSAFTITLPTAQACTLSAEAAEPAAEHARRILVVDDEALVRNALELVLVEMGHQVDSAESVEEALRRSREHSPELVIADFRLAGGTTGIDVIRAVRASCGRDLPAVVLTGDTDPATIRRIVGEGLHLLHKPLRLEALKGFLKQVA